MNEHKSAQVCGCDEGANHFCEQHNHVLIETETSGTLRVERQRPEWAVEAFGPCAEEEREEDPGQRIARLHDAEECEELDEKVGSRLFGDDAAGRKGYPVFTGGLMYFPDAFAAMAAVSKAGNDQHNPGEPLHWAREKSTDQMDTAARHMMDHGTGYTKDSDGKYHLAKALWRIAAELQLTIEREREGL